MGEWIIYGLLGGIALYVIVRIATAAYFRSKLDYMRRMFHGTPNDQSTRNDR